MKFIADLHVHSKFSRATAKNLDLEHLHTAARRKGITLVGTGDFTHPAWFAELREKLVPAEPGLFQLRPDIARTLEPDIPKSCRGPVRFVLQCEISNIYKKAGKTRKNHSVMFAPDFVSAEALNRKLDAIGNITSDGRPILGLDAKDLLDMMLTVSGDMFLIPAHIWTPWFSVFGSKSGFDSLAECFEDLTPHIFAVETGLSSDPPMNWRVSELDARTLVSNSDAHSPAVLGRNANLFDADLSYFSVRAALEARDADGFSGTLDMYPQEGKYHMDGHRNCGICISPRETMALKGRCPKCGKPLTIGVLYRVEELADRPEEGRPADRYMRPYWRIIPLAEMLSEILNVGPKTKTVAKYYDAALQKLGPELSILHDRPVGDLDAAGVPLLGEAVRRMRAGEVHISPGYDGEFGRITVFDPNEKEKLMGQLSLFKCEPAAPAPKTVKRSGKAAPPPRPPERAAPAPPVAAAPADMAADRGPVYGDPVLDQLNAAQREAVLHDGGPLLAAAGPGSGKTRTLTHKIAHIMTRKGVDPRHILAVTFTNKAAEEMKTRLRALLGAHAAPHTALPWISTFHGLCVRILSDNGTGGLTIVDEVERKQFIGEALRLAARQSGPLALGIGDMADRISAAKQRPIVPDDDLEGVFAGPDGAAAADVWRIYQRLLKMESRRDYEDLILDAVTLLQQDDRVLKTYRDRFRHIFIDEYQDLNQAQYELTRRLAGDGAGLFAIGDPDQSIYGFRGSDAVYFKRFSEDFPGSRTIALTRNYRSVETILTAAHQVMKGHSAHPDDARVYSDITGRKTLSIIETASEKAEAVAVGKRIERMVGGVGFHSMDFGKIDDADGSEHRSFSDFAVLYRTSAQGRVLRDVLESAGIPCQTASKERLLNQGGVAQILAFLRFIQGAAAFFDFQALARLPEIGASHKTLDKIRDWLYDQNTPFLRAMPVIRRRPVNGTPLREHRKLAGLIDLIAALGEKLADRPPAEQVKHLAGLPGVRDLAKGTAAGEDIIARLVQKAETSGGRLTDFLTRLTLESDPDACDFTAESVSLMTMHAAKGLEFPVVFITGCEDGLIPYRRPGKTAADAAEERRLFYVAMTRARERLYFTWAGRRTVFGKSLERALSPFAADIENRLKRREASQGKRRKRRQVQLSLFDGDVG